MGEKEKRGEEIREGMKKGGETQIYAWWITASLSHQSRHRLVVRNLTIPGN